MTSLNTPENADKLLLNYSVARNQDQIATFDGSQCPRDVKLSKERELPTPAAAAIPWKFTFPTEREESLTNSTGIPTLLSQGRDTSKNEFLMFFIA